MVNVILILAVKSDLVWWLSLKSGKLNFAAKVPRFVKRSDKDQTYQNFPNQN